ncbi:hypothetical protein MFUL124B02_30105 [Myxococcus fulvus 124B02]|nr:hypothetical protein MFUL124B02_30105 [Myxococcus fulvus 124B02]
MIISLREVGEFKFRGEHGGVGKWHSRGLMQYTDDRFGYHLSPVVYLPDPDEEVGEFQDPPGYLSIRKVEAGVHYINTSCHSANDLPRKEKSASFTVTPGKAIYLGEVHVNGDCVARVFDEWERDQKLVLERMKNLRPEDLEKRLLSNEQTL